MKSLFIALIVSVCLFAKISPQGVTKTGDCEWTTSDTGIILDLSKLTHYDTYDPNTGANYRYYPCRVTEDWDQYTCNAANSPALCQKNSDGSVYLIGRLANVEIKVLTSSTFELTYSGGDGGRIGTVTLTCDQSSDSLKFDGEPFESVYLFSFSFKSACTRAPAEQGGNAPAFFLILLIVSLIAAPTYVVAGVLIMYFYKKARGVELIPNIEFWKDFPFLLKDGFLFTFSCYPPFREWIGNRPGMETKGGTYETVK